MKIGIITYWESNDNYGQQLQCWAMQKQLCKMGHSPFLIRFKRYAPKPWIAPPLTFKGKIKKVLKFLLVFPYLNEQRKKKQRALIQEERNELSVKNKYRRFTEFRSQYLVVSYNVYNDLNDLIATPPFADAYIAGSDQIWNYDLRPDELAAYFLQFGSKNIKRIAYAPSIGHTSYPDSLKPMLKKYLSSFNSLSAREKAGVDICKEQGYEAIKVLDPTLLLSMQDYSDIVNFSNIKKRGFFIYSLNYTSKDDLPWTSILNYAKKQDCPIDVTPGSGFEPCRELFEGVTYRYATIGEWINLIHESMLVVTASFHGIAFSILNHTKFLFTPLQGKYLSSNNRALELIKLCGLEQFIWDGKHDIEYYLDKDINWSSVDMLISEQRKISLSYLESSLNENNNE